MGSTCWDYPLLGGGDANVYSLFGARVASGEAGGIVGLLVPSGIAADKGAASFFSGLSLDGRLSALFDFENRRTRMKLGPFFLTLIPVSILRADLRRCGSPLSVCRLRLLPAGC